MRAEALLDYPVLVRVAGDQNAGFYRPRPGLDYSSTPADITIEAYQWRNLTASTVARTLSLLLLLPFMFSNLAVWMRPPAGDGAVVKALCRLLAATVTAMFVLSVVGITLDLVGWQCVPYHPCAAGRWYLSWLGALPAGARLVVLAVLPAAAIRLLWWVGSRSARAYEGFRQSYDTSARPAHDRLDARTFWSGETLVGRLRSIHVAIAYGTLDASILIALAAREDRDPIGGALIAAAGLLVTACLILLCLPTVEDPFDDQSWGRRATRPLRAATFALTVLTVGYALVPRPAPPVVGRLPGYDITVSGLILVQAVLLTALAVLTFLRQRNAPPPARAFFRGLGAPVFGSISVGLAAIFAAGLVYRVADFLDRGAIPTTHPPNFRGPPLDPPTAYRWAAMGAFVAILMVTMVALYAGRLTRHRRDQEAARISQQDFPDAPPDAAGRLRAVRRAISRAHLAEQFAPLIVAYFTLLLLSLAITALDIANIGPTQLAEQASGNNSRWARIASYLTDVGTFSIGLLAFGLLMVGVLTYVSPQVRRSVGVLWDLGTFFPRTTHPFAPPSYAERAVPELTKRVIDLSREQNVLLSGHSHGSALAAAAILQLPPETLSRVALLTYGSPLRRLYGHMMPAYFGKDTLREVGDRVGWRWRNLWRSTDAIAGPIFSAHRPGNPPTASGPAGSVDIRLRDPRAVTVQPMDTVPPPIQAHWPYYTDVRYCEAVRELADSLDPPDPAVRQ
ncbi:hypothetical protein [Micromonospora sp. NPDC049301]|uniref:hypothetical protein n=1 Tax=Micromonospora sp. NPDC049301 TaxID=3155723 RepID=UPI003419F342